MNVSNLAYKQQSVYQNRGRFSNSSSPSAKLLGFLFPCQSSHELHASVCFPSVRLHKSLRRWRNAIAVKNYQSWNKRFAIPDAVNGVGTYGDNDPVIKTHARFEISVADSCNVLIKGYVNEDTSESLGYLISIYLFYLKRAEMFGNAVLALLDEKPMLRVALPSISDEDIQSFREAPNLVVNRLNSLPELISMTKVVSPDVADQVEKDMRDFISVIDRKQQESEATVSAGVSDLPNEILNSETTIGGTENDKGVKNNFISAVKLLSSPKMAQWKQNLRSAIINSHPVDSENIKIGASSRTSGVALRLSCTARTFDDLPLEVSVLVTAYDPNLKKVEEGGPDAVPSAKAVNMLMFGAVDEASIMERIEVECWRQLKLKDPLSFRAVFFPKKNQIQNSDKYEDQMKRIDTGILGNDEMKATWMALTLLACRDVSDKFGKRGISPWIPDSGSIQFRRKIKKTFPMAYLLKGKKGSQNVVTYEMMVKRNDGTSTIEELQERQIWNMLEAIESFSTLNPEWCPLGPPNKIIGPVTLRKRILSVINRFLSFPSRLLRLGM